MTLAFASQLLLAVLAARTDSPPAEDPAPLVVAAEAREHADAVELEGTFAPADGAELEVWLEEFGGELVFLEVLPHGTFVNAGDAVARLDASKLDRDLRKAELELQSAEIRHAGAAERAQIEAQAAAAKRRETESALARAERAFEGWEQHELELERRSDELAEQYRQHGIDDQEDELRQLEAMYRDDELVDATEEIVLMRSRRNLARSRTSRQIAADRLAYERAFERELRRQQKVEALEHQRGELERLVRGQGTEARKRDDELRRGALALEEQRESLARLRADREQFELRAPRGGVLLHGGLADHRAGATRPEHRRGGRASQRVPLFTVADADPVAVCVLVKESELGALRPGQAARVKGLAEGGTEWVGRLELERFPTHQSGSKPAAEFAGTVRLERPATGVAIGRRARVELSGELAAGAVVVPREAVHGSGDAAYCWTAAQDGAFARTKVRLGDSADGGEVVVREGLSAGQRVLVGAPRTAGE